MAKIRLDLAALKAAGITTIENEIPPSVIVNTQTVRLVVGFSRKGPHNQPVYLPDIKAAKQIYGDIDRFLEQRGSFFHRSLFTCLTEGPVFGLNLLPLNNAPIEEGGDAVDYRSFSIDTSEANGPVSRDLYSFFYNQERFWFPSENYFIEGVVNNNALNSGKILNVVNLGQVPVSVIIRKTKADFFNITARDWFGAGKVPEYIREWDFISDYFVEVIIVQGNWTNYQSLAIDPTYSKYFDIRGLKKDRVREFLSAPSVTTIAQVVGCIIPNFVDGNGVNHSIDFKVNQLVSTTGVFMAVNKEALADYAASTSKVDMVGHALADPNETIDTIDFLSYKASVQETLRYREDATHTTNNYISNPGEEFYVESVHAGGAAGVLHNVLVVPFPETPVNFVDTYYDEIRTSVIPGVSILKLESGKYAKIISIGEVAEGERTLLKIGYQHPAKSAEEDFAGLPLSSVSTTPGAMAIYVSGDITSNLVEGDQILLQHTTNGTYYYIRLRADSTYDVGSDLTMIPVDDDSDVQAVVTAGFSAFRLTYEPAEEANLTDGIFLVYQPDKLVFTNEGDPVPNKYTAYQYSQLYKDYTEGYLTHGDLWYATAGTSGQTQYYLKYNKTVDSDGIPVIEVMAYEDADFNTIVTEDGFLNTSNYDRGALNPNTGGNFSVYGYADRLSEQVPVVSWNATKNVVMIDEADVAMVEKGHYLVADIRDPDTNESSYKLTKVIGKRQVRNPSTGVVSYEITVNEPLYIINENSTTEDRFITRFMSIDDFASNYQFTFLGGFKLGAYHLPGDKTNNKAQLAKILGVIENTNIGATLRSRDVIQFRYIVDTFSGGLDVQSYPKNILTKLALQRQKCLALMNAPSFKEFRESNDPRFTDEPNPAAGIPKPVLNVRYIAEGGNHSIGPSFTYSLPDEENGAKHAGFFCPFEVIRESTVENILVPPAADVSNNFVRKFNLGRPFDIVAGTQLGIISNPRLVGMEYDISDDDRAYLEPFGLNCIIKKKNAGYMIFGNKTPWQSVPSAFNSLHVRDILITIEENVEDLLLPYVYRFNDVATRLEIKSKVQAYLDAVRSNGGIYDFAVVMDESNNTNEVIDASAAVIDIAVEPAKGIEKFVNRITVMRTNGISSGGFKVSL